MSLGWLETLWYPRSPETVGRKVLLVPLWLVSCLFRLGVALRNFLYDTGLLAATRVEGVKVISVGNLNVGGTGKTPAVIWLAKRAQQLGRRVAILSRGTGRQGRRIRILEPSTKARVEEVGDEPALMAKKCPEVPVLVGQDRVVLCQLAKRRWNVDLVLLDDGMQHRRLARDEELVVLDAQNPFGNGHLLPRGPLREPPTSLRRATLLWLRNKGPQGSTSPRPTVSARYQATRIVDAQGREVAPPRRTGAPVVAFCGIARPSAFFDSLEALGLELVKRRVFSDHHRYTRTELQALEALAHLHQAVLLTTEKDFVKLESLGFSGWVLELSVEIEHGQALLDRVLMT